LSGNNQPADAILSLGSTWCYNKAMAREQSEECKPRAFKTAWFAKHAKKARITDALLCAALREVQTGQCDDLGGGVFKKRLAKNDYRSIILTKNGERWIYEYLFAKKDRDNIDEKELAAFRKLSSAYATLTRSQLNQLCANGDLLEICND
jgi:hypothetical protein